MISSRRSVQSREARSTRADERSKECAKADGLSREETGEDGAYLQTQRTADSNVFRML